MTFFVLFHIMCSRQSNILVLFRILCIGFLDIVIWFQVFLSNTHNLYIIIRFQVTI